VAPATGCGKMVWRTRAELAMSLRWRLALLFALGTAAVVAVAGLAFVWQLRASLNAALDDTLQARARALAARVVTARPLVPHGQDSGQDAGSQGQFSGADEFTQVLTRGGRVLDYSQAAGADPLLTGALLRRASAGPVVLTTVIEGEQARLLAIPARNGGRRVIALAGTTTDIAQAAESRARTAIWTAAPLAAAVAGLAAWLLTGAALGPVERMRRRLTEITEHDAAARLQVPATGDEIASLAVTMNAVLDRLQRALTRQRVFVADAGHELRTPLTVLKAELELAARPGRSPQALAAAVTRAAGDTERLIRLSEDLLLLASAEEGAAFLRPGQVDVADVLSAAVRSFAAQAQARRVTVTLDAGERLLAVADAGRLRQAVDNLIDNAIRHAPAGSTVGVTGQVGLGRDLPGIVIEVRDHGPGFPAGFLPHAFERFRRADAARSRADGGAGLGLAIVASIVGAHGGRVVAGNHPEGGARVRIELPREPRAGSGSQ
jgi:two-component system, OmpR family, sensor kinase